MYLLLNILTCLNSVKQNSRKENKQRITYRSFIPVLYFRRTSQMLRREHGSTPLVGSSRTTVFEFPIKEMAIDSLLFIPPERAPTGLHWCWDKSTSSKALKQEYRNWTNFEKVLPVTSCPLRAELLKSHCKWKAKNHCLWLVIQFGDKK